MCLSEQVDSVYAQLRPGDNSAGFEAADLLKQPLESPRPGEQLRLEMRSGGKSTWVTLLNCKLKNRNTSALCQTFEKREP